jgi:hypothetical protein
MELIPILATIVLAATTSTFLLAVGAYILYKIRERRSKKNLRRLYNREAELVTPQRYEGMEKYPEQSIIQANELKQKLNKESVKEDSDSRVPDHLPVEPKKHKSKFLKYTSEGYISPKDDKKSGNIRWR